MNGDTREFLNVVGKIGWNMVGFDGNNHIRLYHVATGQYYSAAFTPSEYRSRRNSLADLERLAGRKLPRPNAGRHRHHRQSVTAMQRSREEQRRIVEIDALVTEADELRQAWNEIAGSARPEDIPEARRILKRYQHIRELLATRYRIIEELR